LGREHIGGAENGVQGFGKAGGEAPADGGLSVDCRCSTSSQNASTAGVFDYGTTIHEGLLVKKMHPTIRIIGFVGCRIVGIQISQRRAGLPFLKTLNLKGI
jgi:hypothetical protein